MKKATAAGRKIAEITRLDGWKNILTGLGVKGKDRREAACIDWVPMTEADADNLYTASDIAGKVVDEIVNEAFREGYELTWDDDDPELRKLIVAEGERLQLDEKLAEAAKYARVHGGAGIVLMPSDVTRLSQPFIPESLVEVRSLLVLTRWELSRNEIESDIRSPNFGLPISYRICPRVGTGAAENEIVHHSRVLRFDGAFLTKQKFVANNYWHDSILNKLMRSVRDFDGAMGAVSAALDDFSIAVMKIKDLTRMIAEDKDDLVQRRMEIASLSRSVVKAVILDADSEDYQYQTRNLTGVSDAVRMISGRLVVASGMPHTKILGESPQGSNATGNSTTKDWYDQVHAWQENYLDKKAVQLWTWILSAKKSPTAGKVPPGLKLKYAPLWQEPESVQATTRYTQAQADDLYVTMAAVTPTEIAVSRFGSGEYSTKTQLSIPPKEREGLSADIEKDDPNAANLNPGKKPALGKA